MSYNPINTDKLCTALKDAGFLGEKRGLEIVYERRNHNDPALVICVYTSAKAGGETVRAKDADAIRICLVLDKDGSRSGVASGPRVYRTGSDEALIGRVLQRAREMYGTANGFANGDRCTCGLPVYADSKKCLRHRSCKQGGRAVSRVVAPPVPPAMNPTHDGTENARWAWYKNEFAQQEVAKDQAAQAAKMAVETEGRLF